MHSSKDETPEPRSGNESGACLPDADARNRQLSEITMLFLKLGTFAFGGPGAHIAMMEQEIVKRRHWLSHNQFLDLLGATNLIPGPNSTEMAIHLGFLRGRWPGLLLAGMAFILPAFLIVILCAHLYVAYGKVTSCQNLLYGAKPVIIAIIIQAIWSLSGTALKTNRKKVTALLSSTAYLLGMGELPLLIFSGLISITLTWKTSQLKERKQTLLIILGLVLISTLGCNAFHEQFTEAQPFSLLNLFYYFLKIGSVLYGSGYTLIAFLKSDLVDHWHWLSQSQLLDAVVIGQITPGPVFTTATFIGYLLAGLPGALLATIGIFLPSFFFVALSGLLIPRIRQSQLAGFFLDGVNIAALVLMATVTVRLGRDSLTDLPTATLTIVATILLLRYKLSATWIILGGSAAGLVLKFLGA